MVPCVNSENILSQSPVVTYTLSSVSLLAEGPDGSGGTGATRSSGGATGTGVTSLALQEGHKVVNNISFKLWFKMCYLLD